jgi:hypothetical protein
MISKDYPLFKERVLSKTNGANIHRINGKLGIVLNSLSNLEYWQQRAESKSACIDNALYRQCLQLAEEANSLLNDALIEIKKETGISP